MKYIVSHKHRFVYFVVPKAACTSIKTAMIPLFKLSEAGYWRTNRFGEYRLQVHELFDDSPNQISRKRLEAIWGNRLHSYFSFAFVRNPWDRLVSCWHQKFKDRDHSFRPPGAIPLNPPADRPDIFRFDMSFEEFIRAIATVPDTLADIHYRSQFTIMQSSWKPEKNLPKFIGKLENLEDDFSYVANMLGLGESLKLPHSLKSRTRETNAYRGYYSTELQEIVAARYARDIHDFDYSF